MSIKNRNKIPVFGKKIIIVTGGIGSGKSYIMKCLSCLGFITFDTDKAIHKLMMPGGAAYKQISLMFPTVLLNGVIDRKKLGNMVFDNVELLRELENILYPLLQKYRQKWVRSRQAMSDRSIVIEVPLFFERPELFTSTIQYDFVITAMCDVNLQRHRALIREGANLDKVNKIISIQVENSYRIKIADFVIDTNKSRLNTAWQLLWLLTW